MQSLFVSICYQSTKAHEVHFLEIYNNKTADVKLLGWHHLPK